MMHDAVRELIRGAIAWTLEGVGDGFTNPEEVLWAYSQATGDEDWEGLADRIADAL